MPMIKTMANVKISEKQEKILKEKMGEAITTIPGKSENWLMLSFEGDCNLYFRGSRLEPIAYLEVKTYGQFGASVTEELTKKLTKIINEVLSIAPDHIYIYYQESVAWGWNGGNF